MKEDYDGAEPSGNSVAILALLKLGKITERKEFTQAAEKSLRLFANRLQQVAPGRALPAASAGFLARRTQARGGRRRPGCPETRALLRAIHSVYQPNKVVLGHAGAVEPFARSLPARKDAAGLPMQRHRLPATDERRGEDQGAAERPGRGLTGSRRGERRQTQDTAACE